MDNFCLILNTNTKVKDVWPIFFGELEKRFPQIKKKYIFVNNTNYNFGTEYDVIFYDSNKQYRDQLLECFPKVTEKYCLYVQEDYILYDDVKWKELCNLIKLLDVYTDVDFIKLLRGTDIIQPVEPDMSMGLPLYYIIESECYYTQGVTIWQTDKLIKVFEDTQNSHIGDDTKLHFEVVANEACKKHCTGLLYYNNESKRGMHHYNSTIVPHIASAIVRGKWNTSEYSKELIPLLDKYNIDINVRGTY